MHSHTKRVSRGVTGIILAWSVSAWAAGPDLRLVVAAQERNFAGMKALIGEGVDVNTRRADGATALFWAVHWNDADAVDALLRAHAQANIADEHGVTPLDLACENGNVAIVKTLLGEGADAKHAQSNGVTPLAIAARSGNVAVVEMLLARGADVNASVTENGQTALMWATAEGHRDVMRTLVAAGANVHAQSRIGFTPLLFAARNGDLDAARILIAAGADVNEAGSDGTHALPLAIISAHDDFALFLLDQKADPNGTMAGVSAIHAAAGAVDMWIRGWYRERGVDYSRSAPDLRPDRRIVLIKSLVAHGADVNAKITSPAGVQGWLTLKRGAFEPFSVGTGNLRGATALWVAAFDLHGGVYGGPSSMDPTSKVSKAEIIRTLLEVGADPNLTTDDKTTPLMAAAGLGHGTYLPGQKRGARTPDAEAAVKLFVEAGVDVNTTNEAGFTALHGAAFKGLNEVIEYLVSKNANINAQDFMKRTAYRMAEGSKQTFQFQEWPETAQLLKQLGADTSIGISGREQERQRDAAGTDGAKAGKNDQ